MSSASSNTTRSDKPDLLSLLPVLVVGAEVDEAEEAPLLLLSALLLLLVPPTF
jgi:hypothetical protein